MQRRGRESDTAATCMPCVCVSVIWLLPFHRLCAKSGRPVMPQSNAIIKRLPKSNIYCSSQCCCRCCQAYNPRSTSSSALTSGGCVEH